MESSKDKPDISKTAHFDGFTPEDYNLFLKKKRERGLDKKREKESPVPKNVFLF